MTVRAPTRPVVHIANFEVERQWCRDEHTLPRLSAPADVAVVNRMDEFALLHAAPDDHVVLKGAPDPDYLSYLDDLGFVLPHRHVVAIQRPGRTVTEDVLDDRAVLADLTGLAGAGTALAAHGVSDAEEVLAERTGLPLAGPDAATCRAVNSKVYSRRVADELDIRTPPGQACETFDDLSAALDAVVPLLADGRRFAVKEAFGVSGTGIAVFGTERRADRLRQLIRRQVDRSGSERVAFVVEEWVANAGDLNYQFTLASDGVVRFDFVRGQLTSNGVHKGHRMPARIDGDTDRVLRETASKLGARLAADGYFGVVGVDGMLDPAGGVYPLVEINARNNMSTYQQRVLDRFVSPGRVAMARHYALHPTGPLAFATLHRALGNLLVRRPGDSGLLVTNFATVNAGLAAAGSGDGANGRLFAVLVADDDRRLDDLDAAVAERLRPWAGGAR
ncbi:hypothetical protein [Pseudonocardia alni]|uniref:preATP grasp domain-containing protein n=1 Tax=Pseudonocardia alni TaxID=33907 RepID=UPI0033FAE72E